MKQIGSKKNKAFKDLLRSKRLAVTPTRISILRLLNGDKKVWTIDEVVGSIQANKGENDASPNYTTVYRCLLKLEKCKIIHSVQLVPPQFNFFRFCSWIS